jgi:hypothetical protein
MASRIPGLENWSAAEIELGRRWVWTWKEAGEAMERLRREDLRHLDGARAIALLCGPADYRSPPRAPRPTSGLVEQQRWFQKAAGRDCQIPSAAPDAGRE